MKYPKKIWINGKMADPRKPLLSAYDRGFLYGDGIYETMRVYDGRLFRFPEHWRRFLGSARGIRVEVPGSRRAVERGIVQVLRANRLREASVRITLTRGPGPMGFDPRPCKTPTLAIMPGPSPLHAPERYAKGILLAIARVRRNAKASLDPALKTTNNLNNILAKMEAIRRGAYEALMLNQEGYLAEGTISNIFFVSKNKLKTPSLRYGLLAGVTRDLVLSLARRRGWRVEEGGYRAADILGAREAFLTSTTMEVMPVTRIVDEKGRIHRVGNGRVGPWAPILRADYQRVAARETGAVI